MDHRKHAARSRERMKAYAGGGAVSEPSPLDWAKAQATDLYNTGKKMVGLDDGSYEPFKNTMAVRDQAAAANKTSNSTKGEK